MKDELKRQKLYREAHALLSKINSLLLAARAKHEQEMLVRLDKAA